MKPWKTLFFLVVLPVYEAGCTGPMEVLMTDGFGRIPPGMFSSGVVGAHTEYHYLPPPVQQAAWAVSNFRSDGSQRAWRVLREEGEGVMQHAYAASVAERRYMHPILVAGDDQWRDYIVSAKFAPDSVEGRTGIVFRYQNDRNYYFFGVHGAGVEMVKFSHGSAYRTLQETVLAQSGLNWNPGEYLSATVTVSGTSIRAELGSQVLEATDDSFPGGKVGLLSDIPSRFKNVTVEASGSDARSYRERAGRRDEEVRKLQENNPRPVVWKKLFTPGFGVGRNVRFGDLDDDGQTDLLIGQVLHHGPKDRNSELSCLTALNFDGEILWQIGQPDLWKDHLTNDVAFQIHDLNGDGRTEVVYCMNQELVVAEGASGKTLYKAPTPPNESGPPHDAFPRILGDSLFFCDVRGLGRDQDILVKDRYEYFWVMDERLNTLWKGHCKTGHYPYASDIDGDGKDEIAIGYSLYDDDGDVLFSLDEQVLDHADGVAIVDFDLDGPHPPVILNAASDEGILFYGLDGEVLKHLQLGHVQNPAVANFRDDLEGLETITINFWGNQGIIHHFEPTGSVYHSFEPVQHGSMMLPVNWTGGTEEYYVLSASTVEGGLFDGWGRKVVAFPADGHPELCNAVLDLTGDCRDEIVVWDAQEMWVYTQHDNPKSGRLYKPERNPLYNYSNYQATVSRPAWSE